VKTYSTVQYDISDCEAYGPPGCSSGFIIVIPAWWKIFSLHRVRDRSDISSFEIKYTMCLISHGGMRMLLVRVERLEPMSSLRE
jgi:hypothetical protein